MSEPPNPHTTPLPAPRPTWPRTVAFGLVFLICGAVIGSGFTIISVRKRAERGRGDPVWIMKRTAERIARELELTPEQTEKVRAIFAEYRVSVRDFRKDHEQQAREIFRSFQKEIEEVLTPEQARKWKERMRRARERALHEKQRYRDGPPPRGERYQQRDGPPPRGERYQQREGPPPNGERYQQREGPPPNGERYQRRDGPPPNGRPPRRPGGAPRGGERPPDRGGQPPV